MEKKEHKGLFEVLSELKGADEFAAFFDDLCTYQEVENMEQRIEGAQLLLDGETYSQILDKTGISSATLSRISRCIQYGSGGYSKLLKAMQPCEDGLDEQHMRLKLSEKKAKRYTDGVIIKKETADEPITMKGKIDEQIIKKGENEDDN